LQSVIAPFLPLNRFVPFSRYPCLCRPESKKTRQPCRKR